MPLFAFKNVISLFTSTAAVSNTSTTETDLISYSMPASTLAANGQKLRITCWLTTAANTNNKTVKLYFGGTLVAFSAATALNAGTFRLNAEIVRTSATAQVSVGDMTASSSGAGFVSALGLNGTPAETLSGAVTIKVTGQSGTTSSDVTTTAMFIELIP
jgi:hypothetical protein